MAKYIDVESLVVAYSGHTPDDEFSKGVYFVLDLLDNKPPADVRPVVRSHWKKNDNGTYSCERCHSWIPEEQRHYANWCLYCGADMRDGDAE